VNGPESLSVLLVGDYPDDPRLGSSKVFVKLRDEFQALGHRCDVVFSHEIGGLAFRQVRQLVSPWHAGQAIVRRLEAAKYDVVDAASAEGLWFGVLRRIGGYDRCAYICRSNGLEQLNYRRMLDDAAAGLTSKPWTRRLWYPVSRLSQVSAAARLADRLLLLNEKDRTFALDRGWQPEDRVDVVPHGVSQQFLDDDPGVTSRGQGLLFCGTWDHMKGIHDLIAAFEQLHAGGDTYRLTILGPGVSEDVVQRAFSEAVRPFVTVVPRAPESQVMQMYREHDALLWTSTYEGFGLVLLEAMSQRLPVIATPVGCAASLVRHEETGLSVPVRDAAAVAAAARRLMGTPALRLMLAAKARSAVSGMSWRATALKTLDVYRRAQAERRAA
jgi:glycosyltransferase involved in cell wall biosynthesis